MTTVPTTWRIDLRCHNCRSLFTVKGVPPIDISDTAESSKCPHCSHEPGSSMMTPAYSGKRHLIVTMEREKNES